MDRRKALFGFGTVLAAPALIKADHLMKLAKLITPETGLVTKWPEGMSLKVGDTITFDRIRSHIIISADNFTIDTADGRQFGCFNLATGEFKIET